MLLTGAPGDNQSCRQYFSQVITGLVGFRGLCAAKQAFFKTHGMSLFSLSKREYKEPSVQNALFSMTRKRLHVKSVK